MSLKTRLGAAIRHERSVLSISQGELARRSGLHRTYVSDLERGARNPSIENIEKLAQALNVPVAKLFERTGHDEVRPASMSNSCSTGELRARSTEQGANIYL
jgi:transcriptional regulator with XRE-family HTH domain